MKALILSGGGVKGAYEAGALEHLLLEHDTHYDLICGVSVGALNAAFLGMFDNNHNKDAIKNLLDIWFNIENKDVYKQWCPFGPISALWKNSIYNSQPLQDLVRSTLNMDMVRTSNKHIAVGAVSLTTGDYKIFTQDDPNFVDAVLASSAFPAFLTPIMIGEELYTDGGVKEITSLHYAIDAGADDIDVIICSPLKTTKTFSNNAKTPELALRTIDLMSDEILSNDIKMAVMYNELVKAGVDCGKRQVNISLVYPDKNLVDNSLEFNKDDIAAMIDKGYRDAASKFKPVWSLKDLKY